MTKQYFTHVDQSENIPTESHFAVLTDESLSYDDGYGDDRHGGRSYSTKRYMSYRWFETEDDLNEWIIENNGKAVFRVLQINPVTFKLNTTITIQKAIE